MLYDPKWEKADPLTIASLIAWLELQPAETTYDFIDVHDCLLCRYLKASGIDVQSVNPMEYKFQGKAYPLPPRFNWIANGAGAWTYGAALARARAE